jgi:hypothetical protein
MYILFYILALFPKYVGLLRMWVDPKVLCFNILYLSVAVIIHSFNDDGCAMQIWCSSKLFI